MSDWKEEVRGVTRSESDVTSVGLRYADPLAARAVSRRKLRSLRDRALTLGGL